MNEFESAYKVVAKTWRFPSIALVLLTNIYRLDFVGKSNSIVKGTQRGWGTGIYFCVGGGHLPLQFNFFTPPCIF